MSWWVYENWRAVKGGKARVHKGSCGYCNEGHGFRQDSGKNGKWHGPFEDKDTAFEYAKTLRRQITDICSRCASDNP